MHVLPANVPCLTSCVCSGLQVGPEHAIDKLLALGSEESGNSNPVDVAPSQLLPSLFPHEQAPTAAASAARLLSHGSNGSGSGSGAGPAAKKPASPAFEAWQVASSHAACNGHRLPSVFSGPATAVNPPAPPPKRPRTPEIAASAAAHNFASSISASNGGDGPHRGWWPAWQQGGPVTGSAKPTHATAPGTPAASAPIAAQPVEDLLAVLQSGSDSDTGSNASSATAYCAPTRGCGGGSSPRKSAKKVGKKRGSGSCGYAPPMTLPAPVLHTPRRGGGATAAAMANQKTVL